jgi:hypothetical protein
LYEPESYSFGESYKRIVINPFCEFVIENDVYKILGSISWEFIGYKLTSDEHNTPLKDWDVKLIKNNLPKSFIQKIDSEIFGSFMGLTYSRQNFNFFCCILPIRCYIDKRVVSARKSACLICRRR